MPHSEHTFTEIQQPEVIIMRGLQASGKSTVSKKLEKRLEAERHRSDIFRKKIIRSLQKKHGVQFLSTQEGKDEINDQVYKTLFSKTRQSILRGKTAILDATFSRLEHIEKVKKIAKELHVPYRIVEVKVVGKNENETEQIIKTRLEKRRRRLFFKDPSTATIETYNKYKKFFEEVTEPHITIQNNGTRIELRRQINTYFPQTGRRGFWQRIRGN